MDHFLALFLELWTNGLISSPRGPGGDDPPGHVDHHLGDQQLPPPRGLHQGDRVQWRAGPLEAFLPFFSMIEKWYFFDVFLIKLITYFYHQSYLKSPLPVKLTWKKMKKIIFHHWKNSKIPKVPSSGVHVLILVGHVGESHEEPEYRIWCWGWSSKRVNDHEFR